MNQRGHNEKTTHSSSNTFVINLSIKKGGEMKKLFLVLLTCLFIASQSQAFAEMDVLTSAGSSDIAVATTGTVYTHSFRIDRGEYGAISYYANSVNGSVDITIEVEQGHARPTTEGSSDAGYVEPVNFSDVVTNLTTEATWYHKVYSFAPLTYARLKITGSGSNNADTIVNIKVNQETMR